MRITESRLRRIIRSVIAEGEMDLKDLTVDDVKRLLNDRQSESTLIARIPKFLRTIFPPDETGHMIINVNKLRTLNFDEEQIDKLVNNYRGRRGGVVGQVFRSTMHSVEY